MIEITDKDQCNGCHACLNICPANCIEMIADEEGFLYPRVDKSKCIDCGKCEKVCPVLNEKYTNPDSLQICYAAFCKDKELRLASSSGGVFSLIAEQIIGSGGVVFGAAFSDDFRSVRHIAVENTDDLGKLRGSKYVQSEIADSFKAAKEHLESGRAVLFSGTPCQIGGLYAYLGKDYGKLFTQDIICHGVPSPLVWNRYVDLLEKRYSAKTANVSFRNKDNGWEKYGVTLEFSDNAKYFKPFREDAFMKGFLGNIYLRPTCYECGFKSVERQADITLADFWGVREILPEMYDALGTSLVWIHSDKGKRLFEAVSDKLTFKSVDADVAVARNASATKSADMPLKRDKFFSELDGVQPDTLIEKYCKPPLKKRIKQFLSRVKRSILKR